MVQHGQVLERMTLVRSGELVLEALYASGSRPSDPGLPVVLAGPHPRFGGSMDSPVLTELVWVLARAGRATLRFNWRGVGASQGASAVPPLPAEQPFLAVLEQQDLVAAIDHHAVDGRCALIGYSFGAAVAASVAKSHPRVARLALIAPLIDAMGFDWAALDRSGVPTVVLCGELDRHSSPLAVQAACGERLPVQVISGATHSFQRGLPELARVISAAI